MSAQPLQLPQFAMGDRVAWTENGAEHKGRYVSPDPAYPDFARIEPDDQRLLHDGENSVLVHPSQLRLVAILPSLVVMKKPEPAEEPQPQPEPNKPELGDSRWYRGQEMVIIGIDVETNEYQVRQVDALTEPPIIVSGTELSLEQPKPEVTPKAETEGLAVGLLATSDADTIRVALSRRYAPGQIIELRCTSKNGMIGGIYADQESLVRDAVELAAREDITAVYTGLQQIKSGAAYQALVTNSYKRIRDAAEASDVERYRWLLADIDSVRFNAAGEVISGKISTTKEEKQEAWYVLTRVKQFFRLHGINGDVIDSGNCYQFLVPIDLPATEESQKLVETVLQVIAAKCDTVKAKVDQAVHDRPRICKLPGTISRKGDNTSERPWRVSKIIEVSDQQPVGLDVLQGIAALVSTLPTAAGATSDKKFVDINLSGEKIPNGKHDTTLFKVGCALRNKGFDRPEIESYLIQFCENRCEAYGSDYVDMCEKKAQQACKYPKGSAPTDSVLVGSGSTGAFTSTPNLEVREIEEPEESSSPLVLPASALTSSVLGDLYDQVFAPNDWPLELTLPALTTVCSVLVPQKTGGVLINPPNTTLFTSLIGGVNVGKTQIAEWSAKAVGIYNEIRGPQYAQAKFGSAEQMWKFLYKYSNCEKYPNAFRDAVLVVPDEWSYLMSKAGIPDASFASTLTTAFYSRQTLVTLGGAGGGKDILIPFPFSLIGGVVGEQFGDSFNSATIGGLYSRLLFGLAPDGFEWPYRDFPVQHPFFRGKGKMVLNPVAVTIAPDVWELTKGWKKNDRTLDRIPEVMVRVATIWASIDGRGTLTAKDVEKLWPLLTFQKAIRGIYRPNPGKNPDAVYANVALGWIKLHGQQWCTFRDLKNGTNFYRRQLGPFVCARTLLSLARDNEIDMWVSEVNKDGKLNPPPADYKGKRPKIGEGLVRVGGDPRLGESR